MNDMVSDKINALNSDEIKFVLKHTKIVLKTNENSSTLPENHANNEMN